MNRTLLHTKEYFTYSMPASIMARGNRAMPEGNPQPSADRDDRDKGWSGVDTTYTNYLVTCC